MMPEIAGAVFLPIYLCYSQLAQRQTYASRIIFVGSMRRGHLAFFLGLAMHIHASSIVKDVPGPDRLLSHRQCSLLPSSIGRPRRLGCAQGPPCVAIFVGRWGSWPPYTDLLLQSMAGNPSLDFLLLSEKLPSQTMQLPTNVYYFNFSLADMVKRLRCTVGLQLDTLEVTQRFSGTGSLYSAAKTNDLKPMFGEAFEADLLQGYHFWGYSQEDVLLGNLTRCFRRDTMWYYDVLSPFTWPNNVSGVFLLLRNSVYMNRLWRKSSDAQAVLSSPQYLVFDEWWGESKDSFSVQVGLERDAGRLRLRQGGHRWFEHDLTLDHEMVACWQKGAMYVNKRFVPTLNQTPCFASRHYAPQPEVFAQREVCMVHILKMKRLAAFATLRLDGSAAGAATEFALSRDGVFLPSVRSRPGTADTNRSAMYEVYSGSAAGGLSVSAQAVHRYLERIDRCVDLAEHPSTRSRLLGLGLRPRVWCLAQTRNAFHRRRSCKNETVRHLCARSCMECTKATGVSEL